MIRVQILGSVEIQKDDRAVESILDAPKRLGLFTYLLLARPRGFQRRDKVLALFWPDRGQTAARNALSNLLYHIRRALGNEVIVNRGSGEIGANREAVWCDVLAYEQAVAETRVREANELYRGPLLDSVHVSGASSAFEQWIDRERDRLQRSHQSVLEALAKRAEERGELEGAITWWRKRADDDPYDSRVTRRLMEALVASGNRAEALRRARSHAELLQRELGEDPSDVFQQLTSGR